MVTAMRRIPLAPSLPAVLALVAACGLDTPKQYLVPDLRVVAVRSSGAVTGKADAILGEDVIDGDEVNPSVTLEALVLDPLARSYAVHWYGCLPGPDSPCVDPDVLRDPSALPAEGMIDLGAGSPFGLVLGPYAPLIEGPLAQKAAAAVTDPLLATRLYLEVPVLAVAEAQDLSGLVAAALKRVRIALPEADSPHYVHNENPAFLEPDPLYTDPDQEDDACTGGTPLAATLPPGEVSLCARPAVDTRQPYEQWDEAAQQWFTVEEDLAWQWYVTGGEIAEAGFSGNAASNPIDFTPPAGGFTVWTILRDGRGGTAWIETSLVSP